jgi:hypothetical protein
MVGAAEGFGGKLIRTVSFLGWTFPVSFLGGTAPDGIFGMFSAIELFSIVICESVKRTLRGQVAGVKPLLGK